MFVAFFCLCSYFLTLFLLNKGAYLQSVVRGDQYKTALSNGGSNYKQQYDFSWPMINVSRPQQTSFDKLLTFTGA